MASINHGNIKNRKNVQEQKYVRGEKRFYDDSDDVILTPHHSSHQKSNNKYKSHRTKPKKYKKGVNYKTGWDEDDIILNLPSVLNISMIYRGHIQLKIK